ncbi:MAG: type II secretion system protein [Candidatus Asgardarchaeia archaeon]
MKRKGFTIVELLTVMGCVAILIGLLVPAAKLVRDKIKEDKETLETSANTQVVKIENGNLNLQVGITYKIPLSPAFISNGSKPTISVFNRPEGMTMEVEHIKDEGLVSFLQWTPQETGLSKMTIITQVTKRDGSEMRADQEVEIFVH